jgi:iron complex outermembrane recepter protein
MEDFKGKRVPFAPENTLHASVDRSIVFRKKWLDAVQVHLGYRGSGTIWWTEANDVSQPYYQLFDASLGLTRGRFTLQCWGKNLGNTDYDSFYFVSMGNAFLQKGRPLQYGATLRLSLAQSSTR